jgi:hypothetical protein
VSVCVCVCVCVCVWVGVFVVPPEGPRWRGVENPLACELYALSLTSACLWCV